MLRKMKGKLLKKHGMSVEKRVLLPASPQHRQSVGTGYPRESGSLLRRGGKTVRSDSSTLGHGPRKSRKNGSGGRKPKRRSLVILCRLLPAFIYASLEMFPSRIMEFYRRFIGDLTPAGREQRVLL